LLDPNKEMQAYTQGLETHVLNLAHMHAELGLDHEEALAQREREVRDLERPEALDPLQGQRPNPGPKPRTRTARMMMPARLINYLNDELWAIQPSTLDAWCDVLQRQGQGWQGPDVVAFMGPKPRPRPKPERPFELDGPVAMIPVVGELLKRNSIFLLRHHLCQHQAKVHPVRPG
jgi:hypothetical protein